ncbi:MAG: hypothetical protein VYA68_01120, partial [Pseudomonadota bacterium]|nr:hypothetical protein [Pseudomonadota bacterium]
MAAASSGHGGGSPAVVREGLHIAARGRRQGARAGETLTYDLPDYRQANNFGSVELLPPKRSDNQKLAKSGREAAPTMTIDSFAVKVDLIKLAVEGMELRALEG